VIGPPSQKKNIHSCTPINLTVNQIVCTVKDRLPANPHPCWFNHHFEWLNHAEPVTVAPLYHHAKTPTTQGPSRRLAAVGHHFMGRASIRPEEAQRVEGGEDVLGGSTVELEDASVRNSLWQF